jgi:hypothetical protein
MEPRVPSAGSQGNPHKDRKYDRLSKLKQQNDTPRLRRLAGLSVAAEVEGPTVQMILHLPTQRAWGVGGIEPV